MKRREPASLDDFAMAAMGQLMQHEFPDLNKPKDLARLATEAFDIAQAMLNESKNREPEPQAGIPGTALKGGVRIEKLRGT